jgi:hypothetical protein
MILKKKKYYLAFDSPVMVGHRITRKEFKWVSSNGSAKIISELDINHLRNIIAKMERGELEDRIHLRFDLANELEYRTLENNTHE